MLGRQHLAQVEHRGCRQLPLLLGLALLHLLRLHLARMAQLTQQDLAQLHLALLDLALLAAGRVRLLMMARCR
jgi:hypothetical protein